MMEVLAPANPGDLAFIRTAKGSSLGTLVVVTRVSRSGRVTRCRLLRSRGDFALPRWQSVSIVAGYAPSAIPPDFPTEWRNPAAFFDALRAALSPAAPAAPQAEPEHS